MFWIRTENALSISIFAAVRLILDRIRWEKLRAILRPGV